MDKDPPDNDIIIEQSFSTGCPVRLRDIVCESCGHVFLCERTAISDSTHINSQGGVWVEYSKLGPWVDRVYGGPVPCPNCNRLQSSMVEGLRVFHMTRANYTLNGLTKFGIGLLVLGVLLAMLWVTGVAEEFVDGILPLVALLGGVVILLFTIPYRRERRRIMKLEWHAPEFQSAIEAGRSRQKSVTEFVREFRARLNQIDFALRENPPGTDVARLQDEQARLLRIVASTESPAGGTVLKPWKKSGLEKPKQDS